MTTSNLLDGIDFLNFTDTSSGWSGSAEAACNMILSNQNTDKCINITGPYSIGELQYTVNYNSNNKRANIDREDPCTNNRLMKTPCWGGMYVSNKATDSEEINAGCNSIAEPSWYSDTISEEASTFKSLTDNSQIVGQWKKMTGWAPNNITELPNVTCVSSCTKFNYSTSILVTQASSDTISNAVPILATVIINVKQQTFGFASLTNNTNNTNSVLDVSNLLKYSLQQNISTISPSIKSTINSLKSKLNTQLQQAANYMVKLQNIMNTASVSSSTVSAQNNAQEYSELTELANSSFNLCQDTFSTLVEKYNGICPLFTAIVTYKKNQLETTNKSKVEKFAELVDYANTLGSNLTTTSPDIDGMVNMLKQKPSYIEQFTSQISISSPSFYDKFKEASDTIPGYIAVSVALVCKNDCSITANVNDSSNGSSNGSFVYCPPFQSEACGTNSDYMCPFSTNHQNLIQCQSIGLYKQLKVKIMSWLNTYVGSNGCIQRMLSYKYNKCLTVSLTDNGNEFIEMKANTGTATGTNAWDNTGTGTSTATGTGTSTIWNPQTNQLSYNINTNIHNNLFN